MYTAKEIAKLLKVKEATVLAWVRQGHLKSVRFKDCRIVRITQEALDEFTGGKLEKDN